MRVKVTFFDEESFVSNETSSASSNNVVTNYSDTNLSLQEQANSNTECAYLYFETHGATFTPSVDANGNLSWTNDQGLPNPTVVNIKGPQGSQGPQGPAGQGIISGGTTNQVLAKHSDNNYDTYWKTIREGIYSETVTEIRVVSQDPTTYENGVLYITLSN